MSVKILYFARLREAIGHASEPLDLPAGVATVADVRTLLVARGGAYADALGATKSVRVAVNQDMAEPRTAVRDGDEIAFFPPVTGG